MATPNDEPVSSDELTDISDNEVTTNEPGYLALTRQVRTEQGAEVFVQSIVQHTVLSSDCDWGALLSSAPKALCYMGQCYYLVAQGMAKTYVDISSIYIIPWINKADRLMIVYDSTQSETFLSNRLGAVRATARKAQDEIQKYAQKRKQEILDQLVVARGEAQEVKELELEDWCCRYELVICSTLSFNAAMLRTVVRGLDFAFI